MTSTIASRLNGISGIRMASAPPANPAKSAIQPAVLPISSTSITLWWLSAVVWSRSIASVATATAVSNPIVTSVPRTSLSIVFGTCTTRIFTGVPGCARAGPSQAWFLSVVLRARMP